MPSATEGAKTEARRSVESQMEVLVALSHDIHAHPETCFEETYSAGVTAQALADGGFQVEAGAFAIPTAFDARFGSGPMVIAICAEYDALPDVGHACGHNIIAASAVGAGLALAQVADELGLTVRVIGTPAEEGGGGKVFMLERGAFSGVHAAMMVHPWPYERLAADCLAVSHFDVHFAGKEAHASAAPWQGVNALDAMTVSQVAIGLLRQQLPPGDQVHGVIREGGSAANIIPSSVTGRYMCRSRSLDRLAVLEGRVHNCFEAGALASGATMERTDLSPLYSHMESDLELLSLYRSNAEGLGRHFSSDDNGDPPPTLSTDMANVSLAVPTIHPMIAIETNGAVNHQPEFTQACVTDSADLAVHDGAIALAWTAIDAAATPSVRHRLVDA